MKNEPKKDHSVDFLLAEYITLRTFRQDLLAQGETRLNFLLATVSGAIVAMALINEIKAYTDLLACIAFFLLLGLLAIGCVTFHRMVERSIGIIKYTRGMNRIRHRFIEYYPEIAPYLVLTDHDDYPPFAASQFLSKDTSSLGLPELVVVINSLVAGMASSVFVNRILSLGLVWTGLLGVLALSVAFFVQIVYHYRRNKQAEGQAERRFPGC